jgi:hypothetical protein
VEEREEGSKLLTKICLEGGQDGGKHECERKRQKNKKMINRWEGETKSRGTDPDTKG